MNTLMRDAIPTIMTSRRLFLALVIALFFPHDVFTQNAGDDIFSGIRVHSVNIRFPQPAYWDSLTIYYNEGKEQYIPATVIVNGVTYDSVGVRFKGQSSYTHPNNKKPFRLAFDKYKGGQRLDGVKGVHLNNCWEDPTFMREKIHLDFCRDAGVSAPRANFARLYVNDSLFAFYSLVEHVDKCFLSSRYGDDTGDLFKAVDGFDAADTALSDFRWLGADTSLYFARYELKTDESTSGWSKLVAAIDTLNNSSTPATSFSAKLNMDALDKAFATDILFGNLDSYIGSGRNFYFYFSPSTSKLDWIVWDVGLSFGAYAGGGVSKIENLGVMYVKDATKRPLFGKVLSTPGLKDQYLQIVRTVFTSHFSSTRLFSHIDSVADVIRAFVYEDPRKMFTGQQFETNIVGDVTVSGSRKPGLKSFITLREANVQSELADLGLTSAGTQVEAPRAYALEQNYPNPFNPATTIRFQLPTASHVQLKVFDQLGRLVATLVDGVKEVGYHSVLVNAASLSSGVYLYRLSAGSFMQTRRMVLIK